MELTLRAQIEKKREVNYVVGLASANNTQNNIQRRLRLLTGLEHATIKKVYGDGHCQFHAVCALIPYLLESMSASDYATHSGTEFYRKLKRASIMIDGHLQLRHWVCDVLESIIFTESERQGDNNTVLLETGDETNLRNNLIRHWTVSANAGEVTTGTVREYLKRMRVMRQRS